MTGKRVSAVFIIGLFMALLLAGCNAGSGKERPAASPEAARSTHQISADTDGVIEKNMPARSDQSTDTRGESRLEPAQAPEAVKPEPAAAEKIDKQVMKDLPGKQVVDNDTGLVKSGVRLVVTRDFGQSLIYDCWVPLDKPLTALELTTGNLKTETAYGGVFITSINGIASGYTGKAAWNKEKVDWFLYYNGKMSPVGANNITLKAGDVIWWDYHNWGGEQKPLPALPPVS
ncbi:MAG: DUF4430 domain-containing protein [Syntrophomonadaceae bacterium]|nr:DUF4430 domain-containing protein [Syntrophomonadaceae bacterium]